MSGLQVIPVEGLPEFEPEMRVGEEIAGRAQLSDGDVIVVSQKIISKAEGRLRRLSSVLPGAEARRTLLLIGRQAEVEPPVLERHAADLTMPALLDKSPSFE